MPVPPGIFKAYDIRGLYGEEMDGDTAYLVGRAFARVLAGLRGKQTGDLRVGLGRDMRIEAPEMARRVRDGLTDEGCSVLDAGMVATEMLYHLVGSRELDGGAMVTASHNPKAYTGVKLVREGALALSGDAGNRRCPRHDRGRAAGAARRRERSRRSTSTTTFTIASWRSSTRTGSGRCGVVVDGGNGMAGPMVGPLLERLGLDLVTTLLGPRRRVPRPRAESRCCPRTGGSSSTRCSRRGANLGIAWDGDADRCFFIDDRGEFVDGDFLTALLAQQLLAQGARRDDPLRRAGQPRGPGHGARARRDLVREPRRPRLLQDGACASARRRSAARSPATTTSATSGARTRGRSRRSWCSSCSRSRAEPLSELVGAFRERYFISGEINSEVADQEGKMRELAERYSDGEVSWLDGVSVDYPDWHFNVRPSNTEPLLRLNLESLVSREDMERKRDEVLALIRS